MPIHPPRPTRRRAAAAVLTAGVVLAGTVTAAVSMSAASASAATTHSASKTAVVSGDARFEVLSPTLIRTEYAGNGVFVDDPTFNAIGRDGFAATHFTRRPRTAG